MYRLACKLFEYSYGIIHDQLKIFLDLVATYSPSQTRDGSMKEESKEKARGLSRL